MKVLSIIGTRPEAIKMAPVIKALGNRHNGIESVVCTSAQHREMLDQVMRLFEITPDLDLNLMKPNQDLHSLTGRVVVEVGRVLHNVKPDVILVQGDTTTVMAASIAAFYHKIPVGHVEAGLRTTNIYSPFPEEANRRLTSVMSAFHFAPTENAKGALLREGIPEEKIFVTGNTVIDALHMILKKPQPAKIKNILNSAGSTKKNRKIILITAHRRENFGQPFEEICFGLRRLAERNPDLCLVYPVHLNPHVREPVYRSLSNVKNIRLTEPVEYDVIAHLMKMATIILTDSGGIQEEAPALGKPVLVLRTETERPEAVEAGVAKVIGPNADAIVRETELLLKDPQAYQSMARAVSPYGDGKAAERIVDILISHFG